MDLNIRQSAYITTIEDARETVKEAQQEANYAATMFKLGMQSIEILVDSATLYTLIASNIKMGAVDRIPVVFDKGMAVVNSNSQEERIARFVDFAMYISPEVLYILAVNTIGHFVASFGYNFLDVLNFMQFTGERTYPVVNVASKVMHTLTRPKLYYGDIWQKPEIPSPQSQPQQQ